MEEILASIRRIIEDGDVDAREDVVAGQEPATTAANADSPGMQHEEPEIDSAATASREAAPLPDEDDTGADDSDREAETITSLKPTGAVTTQRHDVRMGSEQRLMSEQTGHRVADAFAELNQAFEANRRRSFDRAAEDMLRSMMRKWLDDNMPALVERLVREEIERLTRD